MWNVMILYERQYVVKYYYQKVFGRGKGSLSQLVKMKTYMADIVCF